MQNTCDTYFKTIFIKVQSERLLKCNECYKIALKYMINFVFTKTLSIICIHVHKYLYKCA